MKVAQVLSVFILAYLCLVSALPSQIDLKVLPKGRTLLQSSSDRFGAVDDNGDYHWDVYVTNLAMVAIPGFILAFLSLISLPIFLCLRLCCNTLGGRSPSKGFCCVSKEDFDGYEKKTVWINKGVVWALGVCMVVFMIVGMTGNAAVNKGLTDAEDTIINTAQGLIDKARRIGSRLEALQYTQDIGASITQLSNEVNGILDTAKTTREEIDSYNSIRSTVMIIIFIFPVILLALGALGAILNIPMMPFCGATFAFVASFFIWLIFAFHMPLSYALDDVCTELDLILQDAEYSSGSDNPLSFIIDCKNGAIFEDIKQQATEGLDEAFDAACSAATTLCGTPGVYCTLTNCTRTNIGDFRQTYITDSQLGCDDGGLVCPYTGTTCSNPVPCNVQNITLEQCATQCGNNFLQSTSNEFITNFNLVLTYDDILMNEIFPLLDCSFIYDTFITLKEAVCESFVGGLTQIATAAALIGSFLVPSTIAMYMGYKRFRPDGAKGEDIAMN